MTSASQANTTNNISNQRSERRRSITARRQMKLAALSVMKKEKENKQKGITKRKISNEEKGQEAKQD